jgi:FkbM family methyltransferase
LPLQHPYLRKVTKPLRRVRGGLLIGEFVRRAAPGTEHGAWIEDFDGDLSMMLDLTEHMQNQIYWYGYYSLDLVPLFKRVLRPGNVVIDCGANVGELSLVARNVVGEHGQVYAFEPLPSVADRLQMNIDANHFANVELLRKGVGRNAGSAAIYEAGSKSPDGLWNRGLGTLFSGGDRSSVAATIELTSIDLFAEERRLSRLDLMKIDIEGGELPALEGARNALERFKPQLVIELNEQMCAVAGYTMSDVLEFLRSMHYSAHRVGRRGGVKPISVADLRPFQNVYCVSEG